MESLDERAARLKDAQDKALDQKFGPNGLIGVPDVESFPAEPPKPVLPFEDSCYDALIYLREGMKREEVIEVILMRNRISKAEAEMIVDQVLQQRKEEYVNHDEASTDSDIYRDHVRSSESDNRHD